MFINRLSPTTYQSPLQGTSNRRYSGPISKISNLQSTFSSPKNSDQLQRERKQHNLSRPHTNENTRKKVSDKHITFATEPSLHANAATPKNPQTTLQTSPTTSTHRKKAAASGAERPLSKQESKLEPTASLTQQTVENTHYLDLKKKFEFERLNYFKVLEEKNSLQNKVTVLEDKLADETRKVRDLQRENQILNERIQARSLETRGQSPQRKRSIELKEQERLQESEYLVKLGLDLLKDCLREGRVSQRIEGQVSVLSAKANASANITAVLEVYELLKMKLNNQAVSSSDDGRLNMKLLLQLKKDIDGISQALRYPDRPTSRETYHSQEDLVRGINRIAASYQNLENLVNKSRGNESTELMPKLLVLVEDAIRETRGLSRDISNLSISSGNARALALVTEIENIAYRLENTVKGSKGGRSTAVPLQDIYHEIEDLRAQLKTVLPTIQIALNGSSQSLSRFKGGYSDGEESINRLVSVMEVFVLKAVEINSRIQKLDFSRSQRSIEFASPREERSTLFQNQRDDVKFLRSEVNKLREQLDTSMRRDSRQFDLQSSDAQQLIFEWKTLAETLQRQNFDLRLQLEQMPSTITGSPRTEQSQYLPQVSHDKINDYFQELKNLRQELLDEVMALANELAKYLKIFQSYGSYDIPSEEHQPVCSTLLATVEQLVNIVQVGVNEEERIQSDLKEAIFKKNSLAGRPITTLGEESTNMRTEKTRESTEAAPDYSERSPDFIISEKPSFTTKTGSLASNDFKRMGESPANPRLGLRTSSLGGKLFSTSQGHQGSKSLSIFSPKRSGDSIEERQPQSVRSDARLSSAKPLEKYRIRAGI